MPYYPSQNPRHPTVQTLKITARVGFLGQPLLPHHRIYYVPFPFSIPAAVPYRHACILLDANFKVELTHFVQHFWKYTGGNVAWYFCFSWWSFSFLVCIVLS
jgi:hypothetical protein